MHKRTESDSKEMLVVTETGRAGCVVKLCSIDHQSLRGPDLISCVATALTETINIEGSTVTENNKYFLPDNNNKLAVTTS